MIYSVVLIDDSSLLRELFRLVLESDERFKVVGEADNGRDGIRVCRELSPDLTLLDLSMPVMDGFEALPEVKTHSSNVIVLSGFEKDAMATKALELGADGYLVKGVSAVAIIDAIVALLSQPAA